MIKYLVVIIIFATSLYLIFKPKKGPMKLNYIITNIGMPDSFDPLDGDKTLNLSQMRMLFATPIEISKENTLISNVLENFSYDSSSYVLTFITKKGFSYSDGSLMTSRDIAISIARMAYFRPTFPVIKDIKGVEKWVKEANGLTTFPEGIKVDGQKIEIHLERPHPNPLFRFCLELFSIIPEKCINLITGKMNCKIPPSSGYFTIKEPAKEEIIFQKRHFPVQGAEIVPYEEIIFKFNTLEQVCGHQITQDSIVVGSETDFIKSSCPNKISSDQVHWTPAAKFSALLFNPNVAPFNSKENRQFFSQKVRENISKNYPTLAVESSLFSPLLPGYLPPNNFLTVQDTSFSLNFKNKKITLIKNSTNIVRIAIENVAKEFDMKIEYLVDPTDDFLDKAFLSGEVQIDTSNSGFWAQDPVGDLSMYLTPQLHLPLTFLWQDQSMYKIISDIEKESNPLFLKNKMETLNKHLFNESLISPMIHFKKIYITGNSIKTLNLPQAVTSPAPWQLLPQ